MKKTLELIPFLLLIATISLTYLFGNSIPQSIVIFGLTALCGYRFYSMEQVKPDYVQIFKSEFEEYKKKRDQEQAEVTRKHEKAMLYLEGQIKELNSNYGKMTMESTKPKKKMEFAF